MLQIIRGTHLILNKPIVKLYKKNIFKCIAVAIIVTAIAASVGSWRGQYGSPLACLVDVEETDVVVLPLPEGDTIFFSPHIFSEKDSFTARTRIDFCRDSVKIILTKKGLCTGRDGAVQTIAPEIDFTLKGEQLNSLIRKELQLQKKYSSNLHKHIRELDYYARTHNATDGGYNEIMLFGDQHRQRSKHADSALVLLQRALQFSSARSLELQAYREVGFRVNGVTVIADRQNSGLVTLLPMRHNDSINRRNVRGQHDIFFPQLNRSPLNIRDTLNRRFIVERRDSTKEGDRWGYSGHCYAPDGSYYRGDFNELLERDGEGFAVDDRLVKYGTWKADKFQGETMLYNAERIYGIDISRYQHDMPHAVKQRVTQRTKKGKIITKTVRTKTVGIDWGRLRITNLGEKAQRNVQGEVNYPVSFVFIKCTQGTSIQNKYYASDLAAALRHSIPVAPYHFFSHKSAGKAQAAYFLKNARISQTTLPPMLDVEPSSSQIAAMGGAQGMFREMMAWLKAVEKACGKRPILYVSQTFVNKYMSDAPRDLLKYDVWIARYGEYRPYVKLLLWQLSPNGKVDGIVGDVDINVFNGSREDFEKWCNKAAK